MSKKINEAELLAEQEGMGLGTNDDDLNPEHSGNVAFTEAMNEVLPKDQVSQEVKDKNPFQFKYEVKVKKVPKKLKGVAGLKVGILGRVVEVLDNKTVMVDFWTTSPAKFPIRNIYLELSRTKEQVEIDAGVVTEEPTKEVVKPIKEVDVQPVKFDGGKPRMDLIRPEFTLAIGEALAYGAEKYSENIGEVPNYLKGDGFNYSKIIASLERHIAQWKMGNNIDEESGLHHLALAAANLNFLLTYELTESGVDDRVILGSKKRKASEEGAEKGI